MIKRVILCEGKTDAILLSYYLIEILQCQYIRNRKIFPNIIQDRVTEWYEDKNGYIAICAIQGNKFLEAVQEILFQNSISEAEQCFTKIIIITDHDDESSETMIAQIKEVFTGELSS